jgi:hypothetical protein
MGGNMTKEQALALKPGARLEWKKRVPPESAKSPEQMFAETLGNPVEFKGFEMRGGKVQINTVNMPILKIETTMGQREFCASWFE